MVWLDKCIRTNLNHWPTLLSVPLSLLLLLSSHLFYRNKQQHLASTIASTAATATAISMACEGRTHKSYLYRLLSKKNIAKWPLQIWQQENKKNIVTYAVWIGLVRVTLDVDVSGNNNVVFIVCSNKMIAFIRGWYSIYHRPCILDSFIGELFSLHFENLKICIQNEVWLCMCAPGFGNISWNRRFHVSPFGTYNQIIFNEMKFLALAIVCCLRRLLIF